jgi:rod shape-determining protein MreD
MVAVVVQTTLFGRIRLVTPDLVLLLAIVLCLTRIRPEVILAIAFTSGLVVDLLGSSVLGLRAVVFTSVAYLGLRTRDRAEIGRVAVALWAGGLTLVGVVLLMLIGTLFGQSSLLGENTLSRVILVPLANLVIAAALAPLVVRLVDRDKTAFRYP